MAACSTAQCSVSPGEPRMRWTLFAALVFGARRNPALLNAQHGDVVLANTDEVAEPDATVHHLKPSIPDDAAPRAAASPTAAAPTVPSLTEEIGDAQGEVEALVDDVVDEMLEPTVVEAAVAAKVKAVEKVEAAKVAEKAEQPEVASSAYLAALTWLFGVSVSIVLYWIFMLVIFVIVGFMWAFLCMGRSRATKTATKHDFGGEFQPVGLCAWMNGPFSAMLEAICCPHYLWAETVSKLGVVDFAPALFVVFVLMCVVPFPYTLGFLCLGVPVRAAVRANLRRTYKQAGSSRCVDCFQDVFVHSFCCCCAIHQEAQFVEQHQQAFAV